MVTAIYFLIYNLLVYPLAFAVFHIYALFNRKFRRGIAGRYRSFRRVKAFLRSLGPEKPEIFLLHCASMGEFEHARPLLRALKARRPESRTVVMFFSPSGYENVKSAPGVDLFIYAPFDWWWPVRRLFRALRPRALLIAKYDVWPNQLWMARSLKIPALLLNATLQKTSGRLHPALRWFQRTLYRGLTRILTISDTDRDNYLRLARAEAVIAVGDTKYDQVISRAEESRATLPLPSAVCQGKRIFVAGSTWPEDETHLLPALRQLHRSYGDLLTIICPHEPTPAHLAQLSDALLPLRGCRLSQLDHYRGEPVIVIDRIGILANLYALARAAYVGGSFKQNIHNVLEPAVYGIPVLFGPVNRNSHEAQLLKAAGGGLEVHSEAEIRTALEKIFSEEDYRRQTGEAARQLVEAHRGATARTVEEILKRLE